MTWVETDPVESTTAARPGTAAAKRQNYAAGDAVRMMRLSAVS